MQPINSIVIESVIRTGLLEADDVDVDPETLALCRRCCYAIGRFMVERGGCPTWCWNLRSRGIVGCSWEYPQDLRGGDEVANIRHVPREVLNRCEAAWRVALDLGLDGRLINPDGDDPQEQ